MDRDSLLALEKPALVDIILLLVEQNRILKQENAELKARVVVLEARVAELEAQLGAPPKTPGNSSLPPSKGEKANRPAKEKKPRQGRPGVARALCPDPDHVRDIYALVCAHCGTAARPEDQPHVHAYDHIDLPPIRPVTTRVNLYSGACRCCGKRVAAPAPADMPPGSPFGPGIAALVIHLHTRHMVSFNRLVEMLDGLFGLTISEGAIANMLARAAGPFAAEAERIEEAVRASPVIHCDETSARVEGVTCWQWVFGSATAVLHRIAASRGAAVVTNFLQGAKPEVWVSDRLGSQMGHGRKHQVCLAHLIRDAQYAIDAGDTVFAPGFKHLLKRAIIIGHRRDRLSDGALVRNERNLDGRLTHLLQLLPTTPAGKKLQRGIEKCRDKLFVFLTHRDVPPTNNVSERALRPSVIFRKVTNGFRSAWGSQLYADIQSIVATGCLNGRTALEAIRACLAGESVLTPA